MTARRPTDPPSAEPTRGSGSDSGSVPTCVTLRPGTGHATVDLTGELDQATAPQLSPVIHGLLARGRNHITINLDGVTFMDSSALWALVTARDDINRSHGTVHVTQNPNLQRLLAITGLTLLFDE